MTFAKEAWPFVLPFWALALGLAVLRHPAWAAGVFVLGFLVLLFFRDPTRRFDGPAGTVLAPADGVVTRIDTVQDPDLGPGTFHRVVTFLSALDVHVQRAPVDGEVVAASYKVLVTKGQRLRNGETPVALPPES